MKILKWLKKEKLKKPMTVISGDSVSLFIGNNPVLETTVTEAMKINEVRIFEGKVGNKDAVGGVFLGKKIL